MLVDIRSYTVKILQQKRGEEGSESPAWGRATDGRIERTSQFLKQSQKEIKKPNPFIAASQRIKYLGNNVTKEMKD